MSRQEPRPKGKVLSKVGASLAVVAALAALGWCILFAPITRRKTNWQARAVSEVKSLAVALDRYCGDLGGYPPDAIRDAACSSEHQMSEVLAHYLARTLSAKQYVYGPYHEFKETRLTDADGDGFREVRDPWGGTYLYALKDVRGKVLTVNDRFYDIVSAGPDGKLGGTMVPGMGYVPATTPEGKASEQDNVTLDTKLIPSEEFD